MGASGMDIDLVRKMLGFIRWDGHPQAYVRFLTLEDGGNLVEELKTKEAFMDYLNKRFEYWSPDYDKKVHPKSAVWRAASKVMSVLCNGDLDGSDQYLPKLFSKEEGREANIKFNPVCRPNAGWWDTDTVAKYTGLSNREYKDLCWLARPEILFKKLNQDGKADEHLYIILYGEWDWIQVLREIFPNIDYPGTEKKTSAGVKRPKVYYRYYFEAEKRLRFAYLNINRPGNAQIKAFAQGLLKYDPQLPGKIKAGQARCKAARGSVQQVP